MIDIRSSHCHGSRHNKDYTIFRLGFITDITSDMIINPPWRCIAVADKNRVYYYHQ